MSLSISSNLRVLLADDNLDNQRVSQHSLERLGLRADAVADGTEVLAALRRRAYDVVLMGVARSRVDAGSLPTAPPGRRGR